MSQQPLRIMIIDDENIVGKRLKPALEKGGDMVEAFEEGEKALARFDEAPFDIVVTDIRMDKIDGIQILEHIMTKSARTKVIIITGYATVEIAREALFGHILIHAHAWAIGRAEVAEIDHMNILQATLLAMARAVQALPVVPDAVWIDGNQAPVLSMPTRTIIGGDRDAGAISAASILAKVSRDREMTQLAARYPEYGFARHQGYPTAAHLAALRQHGPSPVHRRSFAPVRRVLAEGAG